MTNDYVDSNWCPDCGLPRGVCDCEETQSVVLMEVRGVMDYKNAYEEAIDQNKRLREALEQIDNFDLGELDDAGGFVGYSEKQVET